MIEKCFICYIYKMTIQESLNRLIEGNSRFVSGLLIGQKQMGSKREALIKEQTPFAIILSCSDSRVVPEFIFDAGIGELFVIRIAGNIANRSSIASIEFAVSQLGVELIIVMGHQNCSAVTVAVQRKVFDDNLAHLISHMAVVAKELNEGYDINKIIRSHAKNTVNVLFKSSKILKNASDKNIIKVIPAYYHLDTCKVDFI